jgi:DNA-binding NarL/FixJ family response regulator
VGTVLIIEDDQDSANYLRKSITEKFGLNVEIVIPSPELEEMVRNIISKDPDAIIIDERLQEKSDAKYYGIDLLNQVDSIKKMLPIVLITNYPRSAELKNVKNKQLIRKDWLNSNEEFSEVISSLINDIQTYRSGLTETQRIINNLSEESKKDLNEKTVRLLADYYFSIDEDIDTIVWFKSTVQVINHVNLLVISRSAISSETVDPFLLTVNEVIPYLIFYAEINPLDWELIKQNKKALPENWNLSQSLSFVRNKD